MRKIHVVQIDEKGIRFCITFLTILIYNKNRP